jgi:polygalacturonase
LESKPSDLEVNPWSPNLQIWKLSFGVQTFRFGRIYKKGFLVHSYSIAYLKGDMDLNILAKAILMFTKNPFDWPLVFKNVTTQVISGIKYNGSRGVIGLVGYVS